jgi:hypothetical protein
VLGHSSKQNALREARRVAKPGAPRVTATLGTPELREASAFLAALRPLLRCSRRLPRGTGPFALSADGALEVLVEQAELASGSVGEVECPFGYPDLTPLFGVSFCWTGPQGDPDRWGGPGPGPGGRRDGHRL